MIPQRCAKKLFHGHLLSLILLSLSPSTGRAARISKDKAVSQPPIQVQRIGKIGEWLAFGSGCKGSSKESSGGVKFLGSYSSSAHARFFSDSFQLQFEDGGKGVRECAFRVTIEPPPDVRIRFIQGRIQLQASKSERTHLRARAVLLLGDQLLSSKTWDLRETDFARRRTEELILTSAERLQSTAQQSLCGKAQIVGLDVTFEGKSEQRKQKEKTGDEGQSLNLVPQSPAELEVFFEPCQPDGSSTKL